MLKSLKTIFTSRRPTVNAVVRYFNSNDFIQSRPDNRTLKLEAGYDLDKEEFVTIETNFLRELVYNIEHVVHHMAIIKIGIREAAPKVKLPHDFGIAASTIRYQETTVAR